MKVIRYSFDVCVRDNYEHDVYTLAHELEKHMMKADSVCGCEVQNSHTFSANAVDVGKVIAFQNNHGERILKMLEDRP